MKLKDSFITHQTGHQQILLSTDTDVFSGLVKSNATAAFIISQLQSDTDKEQILAAMKKKYRGDASLMAEDIDKVIETLKGIGALDE